MTKHRINSISVASADDRLWRGEAGSCRSPRAVHNRYLIDIEIAKLTFLGNGALRAVAALPPYGLQTYYENVT